MRVLEVTFQGSGCCTTFRIATFGGPGKLETPCITLGEPLAWTRKDLVFPDVGDLIFAGP